MSNNRKHSFYGRALLMVLLVVFCLPRMHERYFFLAGALAVALAARSRRALPAAVLIELASLSTYWALEIPLAAASCMMLAAIVLALCSFACGDRRTGLNRQV